MSYPFRNLKFPKSSFDIKKMAEDKINKLQAKIEERKKLITQQAEELGITSIEEALTRAEEMGIKLEGASEIVHTKLLANRNRIKSERDEVKQLERLVRNIPDNKTYDLDYDDLEYFGF